MSEHGPHEHTSFIKTPKQLIAVIVLAFAVPVLVIAMLASLVIRGASEPEPGTMSDEAVAKRLKPVGEVVVAEGGASSAAVRTGQQVTEAVCAACHATGALNAPKIGDAKAWAPLIKEGHAHLTETAIKGIRQMPPRGGNPELSDVEVARAVAYMANQSGAKFTEPAAPPGGAPQAAVTSAATPVVAAASAAAAPAPAAKGGDAAKGKTVYDASCFACHGAGVAGAPKLGDKAAWAPRLKQGLDALHQAAIKGKGAMPPKGGNMALSDADVSAAVDFMAAQAK
jgi:cytochrome c5